METKSVWKKGTSLRERPPLSGEVSTEAVVIGGGLAGVLTALFLEQKNIKTIVLEAATVGSGESGNTTAKITAQHNLIYNTLITKFGRERAFQYASANTQAIEAYRRLVQAYSIPCNFEEKAAYLYTTSETGLETLAEEAGAAKSLGIPAEFAACTGLPFPTKGAVKFYGQAQFNPLEFLKTVAEQVTIYEQTKVLEVEGGRITTNRGTVDAKHVVFATDFPFINAPGYYFARMHQERSYAIALENAGNVAGMHLGIDEGGLSFRNYKNTLLIGGGSHRTGENAEGGRYALLRKAAQTFYPTSREVAHWSAQDCMTLDGVPYIGRYSSATPGWYVATGFGKWGMTHSMVAAMLLSDAIAGVENPCEEVFSPQRFTPSASIKTLITDMGKAAKGLSKQVFAIPPLQKERLPVGEGVVIEHEGEKVGAYKDEAGTVYLISTKCPHLGCQLEWNPDEKSWDCPCHGSRFGYDGRLLDTPAQTDLECERGE